MLQKMKHFIALSLFTLAIIGMEQAKISVPDVIEVSGDSSVKGTYHKVIGQEFNGTPYLTKNHGVNLHMVWNKEGTPYITSTNKLSEKGMVAIAQEQIDFSSAKPKMWSVKYLNEDDEDEWLSTPIVAEGTFEGRCLERCIDPRMKNEFKSWFERQLKDIEENDRKEKEKSYPL